MSECGLSTCECCQALQFEMMSARHVRKYQQASNVKLRRANIELRTALEACKEFIEAAEFDEVGDQAIALECLRLAEKALKDG